MTKNVFTYWQGSKPDLIIELEGRLKQVCDESGYNLFALDDQSIHDYMDVPDYFSNASHVIDISDLIRIELLVKHGGIWVDKDVLAIKEFDYLFETIENKGGFIVGVPIKHRMGLNNAILGSSKECVFYQRWSEHNHKTLQTPKSNWGKLPFGNSFLKRASRESWFQEVEMIDGMKTRMECFGNFRVKTALMDVDPECIMCANPSLVHLFDRNCRIYCKMNQEDKNKTLLHKLIYHR